MPALELRGAMPMIRSQNQQRAEMRNRHTERSLPGETPDQELPKQTLKEWRPYKKKHPWYGEGRGRRILIKRERDSRVKRLVEDYEDWGARGCPGGPSFVGGGGAGGRGARASKLSSMGWG